MILELLPGTNIDPEKGETVPVIPSPAIEIKDESMNRGKVPVNPVILKPTRYCVRGEPGVPKVPEKLKPPGLPRVGVAARLVSKVAQMLLLCWQAACAWPGARRMAPVAMAAKEKCMAKNYCMKELWITYENNLAHKLHNSCTTAAWSPNQHPPTGRSGSLRACPQQ